MSSQGLLEDIFQNPIIEFSIPNNDTFDRHLRKLPKNSTYGILFKIPQNKGFIVKLYHLIAISYIIKFTLRKNNFDCLLDKYLIYPNVEYPFLIYSSLSNANSYADEFIHPQFTGINKIIRKIVKLLTGINPSVSGIILLFNKRA